MEAPRHWRLKKQRYSLTGEVCPHCSAKIFPPRDVCPVCGKNSYVDDIDTPPITADTIKFPEHFHYFGDGVDINNEEIQEWIKKAIKWFRENPENFSYSTGTGNTRIHVENFSGDEAYCVVVSKDFYETEIPYEKADYCAQDNYDWNWKNKGIKIIYKDKEGE